MFTKKVGIDLGTANVLVYVKGRGIVIDEPSVVALGSRDNEVLFVGNEARSMLGRVPGSISVVRPMRDGVIADYLITEAMLKHFVGRVVGRFNLIKPEVMICIPAGITSVEKRAVHDAAMQAGAKRAFLIEEPIAAAIGANVPISSPSGNMIVDIGGGTSEAAVISLNDIVVSKSLRIGGNKIDEMIATYVRRKYNLVIGDRTAEGIKIAIGSALPLERELEAAWMSNAPAVVLDLRGLGFIDSSGVKLIIETQRRALAEERRFALRRLPRQARRVLEVLGVLERLAGMGFGTVEEVEAVEERADGVSVQLADGEEVRGEVLIVADGVDRRLDDRGGARQVMNDDRHLVRRGITVHGLRAAVRLLIDRNPRGLDVLALNALAVKRA